MKLLESIFDNQQDIGRSLQGRTFQGFWDYLMSPPLRTELQDLLQRATQIEALGATDSRHAGATLGLSSKKLTSRTRQTPSSGQHFHEPGRASARQSAVEQEIILNIST